MNCKRNINLILSRYIIAKAPLFANLHSALKPTYIMKSFTAWRVVVAAAILLLLLSFGIVFQPGQPEPFLTSFGAASSSPH